MMSIPLYWAREFICVHVYVPSFRINFLVRLSDLSKQHHLFCLNQIPLSETAETEKLLKNSRDLQAPLKEKLSNTGTEMAELAKEAQEREQDTELDHKQFFSEMKQDLAQNLKKCQFLEKIFDKRNTEIKRLWEELQTKEQQLQSLQQEALAMQKRLHEEVEQLQKECKAEKEEASRQRRHVYALEKELKVWYIYGIPIATIKYNYQCVRIFLLFPSL